MNQASLSSNHTTTTSGVAHRSMTSSMSLASAPTASSTASTASTTSSTSPPPSKKPKVTPQATRKDTNQLIASVGLHPHILNEKLKLIPKGIRSRDKMEIAIYNIDGLATHHQRNFIDRLTQPPLRSGNNQVYRNEDFRYAFAQMLVNVVNESGLDHVRNQVVLPQGPSEGPPSGGGAVVEENVSSAPSSDTHGTTNETRLVVRRGPSSAASTTSTASASRARVQPLAPTTTSNNSASSQSSSSKQSSGTKRKRSEDEENQYELAILTISLMRNASTIEKSHHIADLFLTMSQGSE